MATDLKDYLQRLLAIKDIGAIPIKEALKRTAHLVDLSSQFGSDEGTQRALQWCDILEQSRLTAGQRSLIEF
jgi:hypothetical protein